MEIGGVNLVILSEGSVVIHEKDPAYKSFLKQNNSDTELVHTTIRVVLDNMPDIDRNTKIFDSGRAWSMFRDRDAYYVTFHPPAFERPFWLASMSRNLTEVTVYCTRRLAATQNNRTVVSNPVRYPLDQILLMYILGEREGAIVHAAGIDVKGRGYIFPGKSGAGKSTIARQFATREHIGMLSDDRIVVRKIDQGFKAFGTPWPGDAKIAANSSVPIAGLFFLYQGSKNVIKDINPQAAVERLLPVMSIPWYDEEVFPKILSLCDDLVSQVPAYEFHFEPTPEGVDVFEKFISGK